jgi:hypothetical protein
VQHGFRFQSIPGVRYPRTLRAAQEFVQKHGKHALGKERS